MLLRKSELSPKRRVVRRTLYRLLLAAPALPLAACGGDDECSGPSPRTIDGVTRDADGSVSCDRCP